MAGHEEQTKALSIEHQEQNELLSAGHDEQTTALVCQFYEKFPYPSYPLLANLRWQEGYLGSSLFAARLYENQSGNTAAIRHQPRILLAGCGEALPFVLRKIEPATHGMTCVDLSSRSLKRARLRLWADRRPIEFIADDLKVFLQNTARGFGHIDSYGVLHHLPDPTLMIHLLAERLEPNGTCRFMVYNRAARHWLQHICRAFRLLGLNGYEENDRATAKALLESMRHLSPALRDRFMGMGHETFRNTARFVDTFFHAWEIQKDLRGWFGAFQSAGLAPLAIFDRYAELDDLPNPLWQAPSLMDLEERAKDRRYENNLEIFLAKVGSRELRSEMRSDAWQVLKQKRVRPPKRWFSYLETTSVPVSWRYWLWHRHIEHVTGQKPAFIDKLKDKLPLATLQRLARVGAILPGQVRSDLLRHQLLQPMADFVEVPTLDEAVDFSRTVLQEQVRQILDRKNLFQNRREQLILQRLNASQF